jgi:phage shock protein A
MFGAIGRLFRAIGYLFTGRVDKAYQALLGNTLVVQATYDNVISQKKTRINEYQSAIAAMIVNEEKKKIRLGELTSEIQKLEKLKSGALAKAKQIAEKYGNDGEKAKLDPEYIKCQGAYRDFSSSLVEKEKHVSELESDISNIIQNLNQHKVSIQSLMRDLEKIKDEKGEAVADIISAQEEKKIAQLVSGISEDSTDKDLEALRDVRNRAKAEARSSRELAGLDAKRAEDEFLEYATTSVVDDEFDKLIGITKQNDVDAPVVDGTKITE